jgi:hypothetical protein
MATYGPPRLPVTGKEVSRLLTAAVINQRFCKMLLENPGRALDTGYYGEFFRLATEEKARILSIRAQSLADFAMQLTGFSNPKGH